MAGGAVGCRRIAAPGRSGCFEVAVDVGAASRRRCGALGKGRGAVLVGRQERRCVYSGTDLDMAVTVGRQVVLAAGMAGVAVSRAGRTGHVPAVVAHKPARGDITFGGILGPDIGRGVRAMTAIARKRCFNSAIWHEYQRQQQGRNHGYLKSTDTHSDPPDIHIQQIHAKSAARSVR